MGGKLTTGILVVTIFAVLGLFSVQQKGNGNESSTQPQTLAVETDTVPANQPQPVPKQPENYIKKTKSIQDTPALPETKEDLEPPVFHEGMTSDQFKTEYRNWRIQKAAREGTLDQFYTQEQQNEQRALQIQKRREERARWRTSMKEWQEQKREAQRLGLLVPPRPIMYDFKKGEDSEQ